MVVESIRVARRRPPESLADRVDNRSLPDRDAQNLYYFRDATPAHLQSPQVVSTGFLVQIMRPNVLPRNRVRRRCLTPFARGTIISNFNLHKRPGAAPTAWGEPMLLSGRHYNSTKRTASYPCLADSAYVDIVLPMPSIRNHKG